MSPYVLYLIVLGARRLSYSTGYTLFAIYLLTVVKTSPFELVLPGVGYELAIFLCEVPTGVVADVYSRRLSVIIGYFMMSAGFIIAGLVPSLMVVILGLAILGIGSTFVSGALSAWIVDEIGQERASQAFLRGEQVSILANLAGIGLSMVLGSIDLQLTVIGAGIPLLLVAVLMVVAMRETGFQPRPASERESWHDLFATFRQGVSYVRASRIFVWIFLITFIFAGFGESFGKLWQASILENFTLPALANLDDILWFGIISSVVIPVSLIATEIVRRRVNLASNHAVMRTLMLLFLAVSLSAMLFALSDNFLVMLLGIWLVRIIMAMISPLMKIWLNQQVESHVRATVLSIVGQVNAFGEIIIGGPFIGAMATVFSVRAAIVIAAISLLPLTRIFRLLANEKATVVPVQDNI